MSNLNNGSFDELVAGISAEERRHLLNKLNQNMNDIIPALVSQHLEQVNSIEIKLRSETFIYRFILWLRSLFQKRKVSEVYNDDLIAEIAKKVNKKHPGTLMHSHRLIQSNFYQRLKELKTACDFFSPYFAAVNDSAGSFYVFLSMFVVPQISDKITKEADPYTIPFEREGNNELRLSLMKNLEKVLKEMEGPQKTNLYNAVRSANWLHQFCLLPFTHFIAQFTAIVSENYTCPYSNARIDFDHFSRVMSNASTISNEVLEALFLFPLRSSSHGISMDGDTERALNEFLSRSANNIAIIQSFISAVPMDDMGRVINDDYEWNVENFGGAEDWFVKFREEWKKIFGERWNGWLRDQKKEQLKVTLQQEFGLSQFPELRNRPWVELWGGVPFRCELIGGFLVWFSVERFDTAIWPISILIMEGVFADNENRTELSSVVNDLADVVQQMKQFDESCTKDGSIGSIFDKIEGEHSRSVKNQSHINNIIMNSESSIRAAESKFCECCRSLERILHGCLDDEKVTGYEPVQNINTIQNRENAQYKDDLRKSRSEFATCRHVLAEIEPLDLPVRRK